MSKRDNPKPPVPQQQRRPNGGALIRRQELTATAYQGPVPPPEQMEAFERVLPGSANRILAMAEGHAKNRWLNDRNLRVTSILGQVFAFVVVLILLAGGFYLSFTGKPWPGLGTVAGTVASIVWAFRRASKPSKP